MNIGIIAHNAHPISQPFQGGLEMLTFLLVEELVKRGHHVTTLCNKGSTLSGNMLFYNTHNLDHASKDSLLELESFGDFYFSITEFLQLPFDIIHNNSLNHHAIILGNLLQTPYITSFHTPIFDNLNVAIRAVAKNVNQTFTAVSKSLAFKYMEFLPEVETVYNGINLNDWQISDAKSDYVFWSGRICKEKGLFETMDLCYQNEIKLKFAGPISNSEYFYSEIEPRLGVYPNCEYVGHLKQKEVNLYMSKSKAFIFSSTWEEPYGLVIAEALASGTPVVANNIGAASEILDSESGILFHLDKPYTFIDALAQTSQITSENCRNRAETFCSNKTMVDQYEKMYQQALSTKIIL